MSKVYNERVYVEVNESMNDIDYLTDILETVKNMVNNYSYVLNEVSNEALYNIYQSVFIETSLMQRELFQLMFKKGWYCLEEAEQTKIDESYKKYNNQLSQI